MNNHIVKVIAVSLGLTLSGNIAAQELQGELEVNISGFKNDRGQVIVNLFNEKGKIMKVNTRHRVLTDTISQGHAKVVFTDLAYGNYAVSVFHDENDNGILDHNMFKLPEEALGFSNDFSLGLLSGLPSFEKLKFGFEPTMESIDVVVR